MKKTTLILLLSFAVAFPHSALCAESAKPGAAGSEESKNASGPVTSWFDDAIKELKKGESEAPATRGGGGQQGMPQGNYGQYPGEMPGQMPNSQMPQPGGADIATIINGVWRVQFSSYGGSTVTQLTWHYDPRRNTLSDGSSEMQAYMEGNVLHANGYTSYGAPIVLRLQFTGPREAVGYAMVGGSQFGPASQMQIHMVKIV